MNDNNSKILIILEFLRPEYFRVTNSLLSKSLIKKICIDIKNINGDMSKINAGELSKAKKIVKWVFVSIF
tara:strand:+ start:130 stop:339 length:210 start_codon:yes stop_codon:yes gene_type:complete